MIPRIFLLCLSLCFAFPASDAFAEARAAEGRMRAAAEAFLATLGPKEYETVHRAFGPERKDWHFIPKDREGLSLKAMSEEQKELLADLLGEGLSEQGVELVSDIRSLELVLQAMEGPRRAFPRDPDLYHLLFFGDPAAERWGWRFEGHHVSIHATVVAGEGVSMTPTFLGANPAKVPSGERAGHRALAGEEDLAFAFVDTLDAEQRRKAIFETTAPHDIFSFVDRETDPLPIEGLAYGELDTKQQGCLRAVLLLYLSRYEQEVRRVALGKIEADGWESVRFGWAGPMEREMGNYYFIQGPSFLIEYDNTQNNNNHIHSVWRDFDGDFGEDLIGRHRHEHAH